MYGIHSLRLQLLGIQFFNDFLNFGRLVIFFNLAGSMSSQTIGPNDENELSPCSTVLKYCCLIFSSKATDLCKTDVK